MESTELREKIVPDQGAAAPDGTAVRAALWRALHVHADAPPHVLEDEVGLRLVEPDGSWLQRPEMDVRALALFRASVVARARFVEDLVLEHARRGVTQYVILGAGLDTFAQRKPDSVSFMQIFEVDRPGPQDWKRRRLIKLGFGVPDWLRFVSADFEAGLSWWGRLEAAGFDNRRSAIFSSLGVSLYLTKDTTAATLCQIAALAPGSSLAMTYILPLELAEPDERPVRILAEKDARAQGTPFTSFFAPQEILALAREAGFRKVQRVSASDLSERYFAGRADGLRPGCSQEMLVATT